MQKDVKMKWQWSGPVESGITQSMIGKFLTDPFTFFLYYGLGLEEPSESNPNLIWGVLFHKALEHVLASPLLISQQPPEFWAVTLYDIVYKESTKYPTCPDTFVPSVVAMAQLYNDSYRQHPNGVLPITTEVEFKEQLQTKNNLVTLKGKRDGQLFDELYTTLIEHKCKKLYDRNVIKLELPYDLQLNIYSLFLRPQCIIYDLIKIPDIQWDLPPRKIGERAKFYIDRLYHTQWTGQYPIAKKKMVWMDQIKIPVNYDIIEDWKVHTLFPILDRICDLYDYTSQPSFDYQNPNSYNTIFYRQPLRHFNPGSTEKFTREYHNFLTDQIDITGLTPVTQLFKELEDQ